MAATQHDHPDSSGSPTADQPSGETDARVAELVNNMIHLAITERASDVHIDPTAAGPGRVRYRVDGALHDRDPIPEDMFGAVVRQIKSMANVESAEQRIPQGGRIDLKIDEQRYDLRLSVIPVLGGERIVMRILTPHEISLDLAKIGFGDDDLEAVRGLSHLPIGLVICTGPTGSGKTTLLYSMLSEVDRDRCCVMSIEDPVEYDIEGVAQMQTQPQAGLTFVRALRAVMRQDPDVIMVGEIRDLESLQTCVQAAMTGHLVLTTLHANTVPGAIKRMTDIGCEPFMVNSSLAGVIAQRLIRTLCPECKQPAEHASHSLPPEAVEFIRRSEGTTFYGPTGCKVCLGTGYRGRTAIHEILIPDERVRQAVAASADVVTIRNAAIAAGMKPMIVNGLEKAARGITSVEEVCRVVPRGPNV